MRTIAMYLPQFHRVKENDEWWGEGYTEWTAVKNAEILFEEHDTIKHPLNNNYYDLMKKDTMQWQADLMHKYGIDAMCMYHYWFKDGRKILEKPAENLLKWKDIDMPFCFCWANETWARSWSKIGESNAWNNLIENKKINIEDTGVLLEQKYGNKEAWKEHFLYLLPFFHDRRYVRYDDRPVFMLYKPMDVYCLVDMIDFWNALAVENGLKGIYFIGGTNDAWYPDVLDAGVLLDAHSPSIQKNVHGVRCYEYEDVFKTKINLKKIKNKKLYYTIETGYDDTLRRGRQGYIYIHSTPQAFKENCLQAMYDSMLRGYEVIFINAWNEWGEGMVLEPSKEDGELYLEAIKSAKQELNNYTNEKFSEKYCDVNEYKNIKELKKYQQYYKGLNNWLILHENRKSVVDFFKNNKLRKIAIYGYNDLCKRLVGEIENEQNLQMVGIIDAAGDKIKSIFTVYNLEYKLDVDIVVVAVYPYYKDVKKALIEHGYKNIISLEHIIMETV